MNAYSLRRIGGALLLATLVAGLSPPVQAQESVDDLTQLPLIGHLSVGSETPGKLTTSDPLWMDGSHVQAWGLELGAGATVTVDLLSDEFDAYLMVTGPGLDEILSDDDGAGACDSRVTLTAPQSATYRVVVNTLSSEATGRFRIRVTQQPGPVTAGECELFDTEFDVELFAWLMALPTDGRVLSVGQEVRGELTTSDSASWDGSYAQAWALGLRGGQEATVDLLSDDFDAYLLIVGPGLDEPLSDDDGAGGCDARVTFTAAEAGTYRVVVNTLMTEVTGRFRLRATDQPGPVTAGECVDLDLDTELSEWLITLPVVGELRVGEEVTGELTTSDSTSWDDSYLQVWELYLQAGQRATVDLLSTDFDAYLMLVGPGMEGVEIDDDSAGACDARITFTAPESGPYRVVVNTISAGATGGFRLRVTEEPGPMTRGECGVS